MEKKTIQKVLHRPHYSIVLSMLFTVLSFLYDQLIIVSDSPSSQYRNRYSIYLLRSFCKSVNISSFEWVFTEVGHGKGPADGIGAAIKRIADAHVAHGQNVLNAADLIHTCSASKILCFQVRESFYSKF
jgi:hypothetical protein